MKNTELIDSLKWRYATKIFDSNKKISPDDWSALEESLVLTPSSFGLQPWKFIIVENPDLKEALLPHSWHQSQVVNCDKVVVFAAKKALAENDVDLFTTSIASTRGVTTSDLKEYRDLMAGFVSRMSNDELTVWAKNQVYIALGQFMTSAAVLGIDACPMEGIVPTEYDKLLGLEDSGYTTTLACPVGYRSTDDKYAELAKVRYPIQDIVSHQ